MTPPVQANALAALERARQAQERHERRIDVQLRFSELGKFKWGSRLYKPEQDRDRPRCDSEHSKTTVEFRDALLGIARGVYSVPGKWEGRV